jgi:hypothetical protein
MTADRTFLAIKGGAEAILASKYGIPQPTCWTATLCYPITTAVQSNELSKELLL